MVHLYHGVSMSLGYVDWGYALVNFHCEHRGSQQTRHELVRSQVPQRVCGEGVECFVLFPPSAFVPSKKCFSLPLSRCEGLVPLSFCSLSLSAVYPCLWEQVCSLIWGGHLILTCLQQSPPEFVLMTTVVYFTSVGRLPKGLSKVTCETPIHVCAFTGVKFSLTPSLLSNSYSICNAPGLHQT